MRISDWSSDVCSSDLSEIETAIAAAKTAVDGDNVEEMKSKAEALAQVAMKLGQAIYEKEQAAASPGGADAESAKADEDVVDAEFSEVDERSEEHTSELQSLMRISYAVFCLKKHKHHNTRTS